MVQAMKIPFAVLSVYCCYVLRCQKAEALSDAFPKDVRGVLVQRTSLLHKSSSPYSFVVSSLTSLNSSSNFLATQVWPSARFASFEVQKHVAANWKVCEFGCGPGLPSLTAASHGCSVLATDVDEFALDLVQHAAQEQGLNVQTQRFDLIADSYDQNKQAILRIHECLGKKIDLIIFSDVFESADVARGAAHLTKYFLSQGSKVWTFAQSDRAQRQAYVSELNELLGLEGSDSLSFTDAPYSTKEPIWLYDLDETKVVYG
jgi:predicted nicotinamide N-methyase